MFSLYGIYHTQKTVFDHISTPKRAENAMHSGVFLTNFEVFGNVVKQCPECWIYIFNRK